MKRTACVFLALLVAFLGMLPLHASDACEAWGGFGVADNVYSHASTGEKLIALTFDDGPHPKRTGEILDILSEFGVKATFFVIGKNAQLYPRILKRIASEGHEIGNHTFSHMVSDRADSAALTDELKRTEKLIFEITGKKPTLFRPPTGYCNRVTLDSARELGYKIIVWTVDTKDWAHSSRQSIVENVTRNATSGSIILMHDFIAGDSPTPSALRSIIPTLLAQGYEFVTVSDLLSL